MPRPTWLTPFAAVWKAQFPEAQVPFKMLAQQLSPLVKVHPADRIRAELAAYLAQTPPQFLNLSKFAATFGSWNRPQPRRAHSQTVDEMDRNAGILP